MQANFEGALEHVLVHEGGFVDHPRDPGGATNKGVTFAVFQNFFGTDKSVEDLKAITDVQLQQVYKAGYWDRCRCDELPDGINYVMFDQAVNSGPGRSAKWLQAAIGATVDGGIGPRTIAAASAHDADQAINDMCDGRRAFMKRIRNGELWETFGVGWQRRVDGVRQHGLALSSVRPGPAPVDTGAAASVDFDIVKQGSRGAWVTKLQEALEVEADGIFGSGTEQALKAYQEANGLEANGIAGRNTFRSLGLIE